MYIFSCFFQNHICFCSEEKKNLNYKIDQMRADQVFLLTAVEMTSPSVCYTFRVLLQN